MRLCEYFKIEFFPWDVFILNDFKSFLKPIRVKDCGSDFGVILTLSFVPIEISLLTVRLFKTFWFSPYHDLRPLHLQLVPPLLSFTTKLSLEVMASPARYSSYGYRFTTLLFV